MVITLRTTLLWNSLLYLKRTSVCHTNTSNIPRLQNVSYPQWWTLLKSTLKRRTCQGLCYGELLRGNTILFDHHLPVILTCVKFLGKSLSPFRDKMRQSLIRSQVILLAVVTELSNIPNSSRSLSTTKQKSVFSWCTTYRLHYHAATARAADKLKRPANTTHRRMAAVPHKPGHSFYPLLSHWSHAAANHIHISPWHHFESRFPRFSS